MRTLQKSFALFISIILFQNYSYAQDVPYVPTSYEVVEGMLNLAKVTDKDVVYDLGCGDGRIVVMAAEKFGARGLGVDSNPQRIEESNANAEKSNVTDKVEFKQQNLFETDLSQASVVTLYLLSDVNIKLRPKLFKELKPGSRVVSNSFDMDDWKADEWKVIGQRNIYFWRIPYNFSGTWEYTDKRNTKYVLQLDQKFQNVSGTVQADGEEYEIKNVKIEDDKISFTADRNEKGKNQEVKFEGRLKDNTLEVKVSSGSQNTNITATRDPETMKALDPSAG